MLLDYSDKLIREVTLPPEQMGLFPTLMHSTYGPQVTPMMFREGDSYSVVVGIKKGSFFDCVQIGRESIDSVVKSDGPEVIALGARDTNTGAGNQDYVLVFPYNSHDTRYGTLIDRLAMLQKKSALSPDEQMEMEQYLVEFSGIKVDATCWHKAAGNLSHNISMLEPGIFTNSQDALGRYKYIRLSHERFYSLRNLDDLVMPLNSGLKVLAFAQPYRNKQITGLGEGWINSYMGVAAIFEPKNLLNDYGYMFILTLDVKLPKATNPERRLEKHLLMLNVPSQATFLANLSSAGVKDPEILRTMSPDSARQVFSYLGTRPGSNNVRMVYCTDPEKLHVDNSKTAAKALQERSPFHGRALHKTLEANLAPLILFAAAMPAQFELVRELEGLKIVGGY